MTQQLSAHSEQTTQWLRVCPSTRTWSSVLTEPEPDPLLPQNSDRTRIWIKFKWRLSQWCCLPVQLSEPASMMCLKIDLFRTCSVSEPASMVSSKSTSSMSVFNTVSLLQWHVWRSTSSEPVQSVSLLQWCRQSQPLRWACQNQNPNQIQMKIIAMVLSTCLTKWACFNDVFEDWPLQNLFSQWACFNDVIKVDLFDERVRHSEPASMTCLKINLFRTCSVSESASMAFSS